MRKKRAVFVLVVLFSSGALYLLYKLQNAPLASPVQPKIASDQVSNQPDNPTHNNTLREVEQHSTYIAKKSSSSYFVNAQEEDPTLQGESSPTYLNLSAFRAFLAECKLADGGFMVHPLAEGIPLSETWSTFLIAWTSEFLGLRELVGTYRGRSPLDYFAQLATPDSGYWNSTLTPMVTVFSTALAVILWHTYPQELSLLATAPGEGALAFLLDSQEPTGGFAEPHARANLFTTALTLQALAFVETQPHNPFTLRTYVQSLYRPTEGRFDDPALEAPGLWETWYGLWAAHFVVPWQQFPEVKTKILSLQQPDGSWGNLADTFVALASLGLLGALEAVNHTQLLTYVKNCQYLNESDLFHGGFKDSPTSSSQLVSSTNSAYAVYILHVLEGVADEIGYTFSTDQSYYIQGEPVDVYVDISYGDESLEALVMTLTLVGSPFVTHETRYDAEYETYWYQFDTTSLFAMQTIEFSAYWEPTFLSPQIQAPMMKGTFVVGYDIEVTVEQARIEPGKSTNYTVTVSNRTAAVPYPVNVSLIGPIQREILQFTTAVPNGTTEMFSTAPNILLGTYLITAELVIPNTNVTRSAEVVIEVDSPIEIEVERLMQGYTVGDLVQLTVRSWYNSSNSFPTIPLSVRFDYQGVVSWATDPISGNQGIYQVNNTIPLEPILGEVTILGVFHFPDFEREVKLGSTSIRFALTAEQVKVPEVAYLARPLYTSYVVSSAQIPSANLTDFQSFVNLTTAVQSNNRTFSRQLATVYQDGQYVLNWTVEPNLPATVYNLTIIFQNPFGEIVPAFQTTVRFEKAFHMWVSPDFSSEVPAGDQFQLYFALYWSDNPDHVNLLKGAIGNLELEASSPSLNISSTPISLTTLAIGSYSLPGYGLSFTVPEDTPEGAYEVFIHKSRTGEHVTTVEVEVLVSPIQQHGKWVLPVFVLLAIAIILVLANVGFAQWRLGQPERSARRHAVQEAAYHENLSQTVRAIDRELRKKFKDPILQGWPRKRDKLVVRLQAEEAQPDVQAYIELEKQHAILAGTLQQRLGEIQQYTRDLIRHKIRVRDNEGLHTLRVFHGDPLLFIERYGIQALQHLTETMQQFITGLPTEEQTPFQPVLHLFTDQAVTEIRSLVEELDQLHQDIELLKTSEDCEEQITRYLEMRTLVQEILQLKEARLHTIRELDQLNNVLDD